MNRIKSLRQAAGFSCAELARRTGMPYSTVQKGELNYSQPCPANMERIAKALGVTVEALWEVPHVKK